MADPVEFKEKKMVSLGLMWWVCTGLVVATFLLTTIYNRFLFVEAEFKVVTNRMDNRYSRQQQENERLWDAIEALQKKNTDHMDEPVKVDVIDKQEER